MENKKSKKNKISILNKFNMSNIGIMLIILVLGVFNFIIGANEKGLRVGPISILMGLILIFLIIKKIKNRKESVFFKSKIDYLVLFFMITTTFPLIFKTWASYSDTVEFVMKYFFIYSVYILVRNVIKDKKSIEIIISVTLIFSLIPIILKLECFKSVIKWLNVNYTYNGTFHATFGYANALAIYMAFCVLLSIHKFILHKNKFLKLINILYILFSLYIIYLTEAKAVMVLLGITCFIMLIAKLKRQIIKHKTKILIIFVIILFFVIIFLSIALRSSKIIIKENENLKQYIKYNFKENQKYTLELELETIYKGTLEEYRDSSFTININEVGKYLFTRKLASETFGEFNGKYKIEFTPNNDNDFIKFEILNNYKGVIKINKCYINGEEHIINYKYIPNEVAYILSGYRINEKSFPQRLLMYNDCLKILKDSPIVGNGGNAWKNVSRAVEEYQCALKESHSYFFELLISYGIVGTIAYYTFIIYFFIKMFKKCKKDKNIRKEKLLILLGLFILILHSLIDFEMSFMLIQLIVYIYVAILLHDGKDKNLENAQEKNKEKCLDNNNELVEKFKLNYKKYNIIEYALIIFLIFILSIYIRACISQYILTDYTSKYNVTPYNKKYYNEMIKKDIKDNEDGIEILNKLQDYMEKELYNDQTGTYRRYFNVLYENIYVLDNCELKDYLDFGINRLETVKFRTPLYFDTVCYRTQMIVDVIKKYQKYLDNEDIIIKNEQYKTEDEKKEIISNSIEKLKQIIKKEYAINIENMKEYEKTGLSESNREKTIKQYQEIIDSIEK